MSVNQHREQRDARLTGRRRSPRPPFPPAPGPRRQAPARQAGLDQQQTIMLEALRRARGETVSYEELRDAGIEYPASVVSELELSGWPLERSFGDASRGGRRLGVRLDPRDADPSDSEALDGGQATQPRFRHERAHARGPGEVSPARSARADRALLTGAALAQLAASGAHATAQRIRSLPGTVGPVRARWLAPALLIVVAGVVAALIASGGSSATGHRQQAASHKHRQALGQATGHAHGSSRAATGQHSSTSAAPRASASTTAPAATEQPPAPATPSSPATAAQLEARGHTLLAAGQLAAAIQLLRGAAAATGGAVGACREPVDETCLNYGYALYDLGRALRLNHQAAAAVPILEDRLKIANQRSTVLAELQLARREAGRTSPSAPAASAPAPTVSASRPPGSAPRRTGSEGGD